LPVKVTDTAVVTFGDVASIRRTYKDPSSFARLNGQPTLVLEISKRLGANIIETIDSVKEAIESERGLLPPSLKIGFHQDKSAQTKTMLSDLQNNVISGVVLVMIVIMATLGIRSSILVGFAIPGSFLTGIMVINAMGYTMNVVVLFSLILVVGMLVDGAIIVSELADRNIFFPLLFWPGIIGQFMRYMPITVISCLIASLSMALIFIPVIGKFIGRKPTTQLRTAGAQFDYDESFDPTKHGVQQLIDSASGAKRRYMAVLHSLLNNPVKTLLSVLLFTVLSYFLYGALGKGVEFFPGVEPESMAIQVHARGDLSIYECSQWWRRDRQYSNGVHRLGPAS